MRHRLHAEEPTPGLCSWCQRLLADDEGWRIPRDGKTHFACDGCKRDRIDRQRAADKAPREDTISSTGCALGAGWRQL